VDAFGGGHRGQQAALDLAPFLAAYRRDGWGRAAHDPAMMA
jgi:hypothetical protein